MEAANRKIADVFSSGGNIHYVLPHFQREYIWGQEQWEALINDLIAVYEDYQPEKEPEHFLGSVVVINDGTKNGTTPAFKLVDGQQRLITISLMLCVLRELTKVLDPTLAIDPQLPLKIEMMLVNFYETGDLRFKVFPSTKYDDRAIYISIINGNPPTKEESNIAAAYHFLHNKLCDVISEHEISIEKLYTVLINCFQVVLITLNSQSESPYKIFESLNAKGKPLSQADKVRNYIAMTLPSDVQESVFEKDWARIEELLQEQNKIGQIGELTAFLRHYLAMQRTTLPSEEHVYPRFRSYIEQDHSTPQAFVEEIDRIRRFAEYYDKLLRPERETHNDISKALIRLNTLDASTAYPLLLAAYNAYQSGSLTIKDFISFLKMLENHMVRRYICAERTNNLNKWYPTLWREIVQNQEELLFTDACRKALSAKYYPTDRQLQQSIQEMKLYGRTAQHRAKVTLILETIEYHLWVGTDVILRLNGKSTIEHIMPQAPTPSWKNALGKNWQQTYFEYVHTLGNLTLVTQGKNVQLSNLDFARKKQILVSQGLRINSYFKTVNHWGESAIRARADWLAQQIIEIWPSLSDAPPTSYSSDLLKVATSLH